MIPHNLDDKLSHKNLPALNSLRCFEAAARQESFSKAAGALNLTHGAVSRQVRHLEDALGYTLFDRHHRRVTLTAAGRHLQKAVSRALADIATAMSEARSIAAPRELVLSCEPTLLMRWLIPRLTGLQLQRPDLKLHLMSGGGSFSFAGDGIDIAIRRNDFDRPDGIIARKIMPEWIGPVCPAAMADALTDPAALATLPRLHTRTRPEAWQDWQGLAGPLPDSAENHWFDHFYFSLQAATSGLGMAIAPYAFVREELLAGTLVAPFGFQADGSGYYLMTLPEQETDERIDFLLTWLRGEVTDPPPELQGKAIRRQQAPDR